MGSYESATAAAKKRTAKAKPAQSEKQRAEARRLIKSAEPKNPVHKVGYKPKRADLDLIPPRDRATYTDAVLAVACPKCGAPKGAPCVHELPAKAPTRALLGYAHGARRRIVGSSPKPSRRRKREPSPGHTPVQRGM
jgi:hypothetical protein